MFNTVYKNKVQSIFESADIKINGDRPWDIQLHNDHFYRRVFLAGSLGLGESYVDGWWDVAELDQFFDKLFRGKLHKQKNFAQGFHNFRITIWNQQKGTRSFQVGKDHYDLGNDLYHSMLDTRLNYSCGYWKDTDNIDQAQVAKLDLICRKLQLRPGMTVLDIGCGWGSFMKYAAENYHVSCVGLTVSQEQKQLGEKLCQGLPIKFLLQDYRTFAWEQFDRIVSIGMFEHVGDKNYPIFMEKANSFLKDDGLFLLHTTGGNNREYGDPWFDQYIFPNTVLPSNAQIFQAVENRFVVEDWHNFGPYYDRTFMQWFHNFNQDWEKLQPKYGDRFYRIWKFFLLSCAGSFRARNIHIWQFVMSKNGVVGGYDSIR